MSGRIVKHLEDIRDSCDLIAEYAAGGDDTAYAENSQMRDAIERRFTIIGEAMTRLRRDDAVLYARVPHATRIVAFRNIVVHGYDALRPQTVWQIVTDDVPRLRDAVDAMLAGLIAPGE